MQSPSRQRGPFPLEHAFVVQFAVDTALDAEHMTGRVEHLLSGRSARFQSLAMLQSFVARVLEEENPSSFNHAPGPDESL